MLHALLDSQGYKLSLVNSGSQILETLRVNSFEVLILAVDLPDVSNIELVESILRLYPDIQVIVSTSAADVDAAIRSLRVGVFDVLQKDPLDAPRALAIVKRAVDGWNAPGDGALSAAQAVLEHGDPELLPQVLVEQALAIFEAQSVRLISRTESGGFAVSNSASAANTRPIGRDTDLAIGPALADQAGPIRLPLDRDDPRLRDLAGLLDVNCLILPIIRDSRLSAYLTCHRSAAARRFSRGDIAQAVMVTALCALALEGRAALRDVRRRHATLLRAWKRIVEAQRLEAMGRQAATLALEVQNPTAYVEGHFEFFRNFVQALEKGEVDSADIQGVKQSIDDAVSGLRRIGLAAAELSRLSTARDDVEFELGRAVDTAIRMCEELESEVVVRIDDVILKGNMGKFSQAVTHLLVNADEAMRGCEVRKISVHTKPIAGNRIELVIEDHGRGISDEHIDRITEPFFTTKDDEAGVGLGLSTARDVVEQLGGALNINSSPGRGTKVSLLLPIVGAREEILALGD
jgi:signal transduction histidine kinase